MLNRGELFKQTFQNSRNGVLFHHATLDETVGYKLTIVLSQYR